MRNILWLSSFLLVGFISLFMTIHYMGIVQGKQQCVALQERYDILSQSSDPVTVIYAEMKYQEGVR